ncbi:MAG TPA: carboxypeptidase regulatory-like domain-containing protein [Opitutaceae bacterium]|nr:carboxypeptidase regulatory-like domain-containing protein [Opitutaceae bacterium]
MHIRSSKFTLTGLFALMLAMASVAFGQGVTTSEISGFVTGQDGRAVAGATVIAVHTPSGTRTSAVTRSGGAFDITGLRPGGPYTVTVTAGQYQTASKTDIYVDVGSTTSANFALAPETVVKLEAVTVSESRDPTFGAEAMSTGIALNNEQITDVASIRRDLQDLENLDPRVFAMQASVSDPEFQLSAQGQNYRSNALLVDGVSINDSFGLNSNSYAGLRNPIPPDWVESLTFDLNPYDLTHSGFTGAELNAVLKSGTNEFHGSLYEIYTGTRFRGPDAVPNAVYGTHEPLNEHTTGATIGGPIVKDKVFFFAGYDAFREIGTPPAQFFNPNDTSADAAVVSSIVNKSITSYGYNPGTFAAVNHIWEQNFVGKLDWNISDSQKFQFTFRHTSGSSPNFQSFTGTSFTSFSGQWYSSPRKDTSLAAKINSDWNQLIPGLSTEFEGNYHRYNGSPGLGANPFPNVVVDNVQGLNLSNHTVLPTGAIDFGTDSSRQLNNFYIWEYESHLYAEYSTGAHTIKFGGGFDRNEYLDTFIQNALGNYTFANVNDWLNGTPTFFALAVPNTAGGFTSFAQDVDNFAQTDFFALIQDTWKPTPDLTLIGGVRFDDPYFSGKPAASSQFANVFGYTNSYVPSGNDVISPRLGFNYTVPTQVKTQVRGGIGLFMGPSPAILIGNAFGNAGQVATYNVGSTSFTASPIVLSNGQNLQFPGAAAPSASTLALLSATPPFPTFNITQHGFKWPSLWKANLAIDRELPWWNLVLTLEGDWTKVNNDPFFSDINLKAATTGPAFMPDGAIRYAGNITPGSSIPAAQQISGFSYVGTSSLTSSTAVQLHPTVGAVMQLGNTNQGATQEYTVSIHRSLKNHIGASLAYTHTHATQVEALTSSVAVSDFTSQTFLNPNDNTAYRSDYAVPNKFVGTLTLRNNFFKGINAPTTLAFQAIWQSGHPYSYTFFGDADGSGVSNRSLFYVPSGPNDPKVAWASATEESNFFQFLQNTPDLAKWSGRVVPRNATTAAWNKTVNVHFEQVLPIYGPVKVSLFADCFNFANLLSKNWGINTVYDFPWNRTIAGTFYNAAANGGAGQYIYTFNSATLGNTAIYSDMSRWNIQVGAKLTF